MISIMIALIKRKGKFCLLHKVQAKFELLKIMFGYYLSASGS